MDTISNRIRVSNIELLRIIAMLMIVMHHILVQGVAQVVGGDSLSLCICDDFVIYGVNIFLLISGYFLIKFTWRKLFSLLWICCFYKIFHLCFRTFILHESQSIFFWIAKPLGVLFSTGGWFMDIYLLLFLLSPIINKALTTMSSREYKIGLIILLAINICWGWIKGDGINPNGYTVSQFCMMYYIGYGCRLVEKSVIDKYLLQRIAFAIFVCSICLTLIVTIIMSRYGLPGKLFDYNNPIVICCSVSIFMIAILSKPFQNTYINFVASSMLPVYLIHHQGGFVGWYMNMVAKCYVNNIFVVFVLEWLLIIFSLFAFAIAIDQVRTWMAPFVVKTALRAEQIIVQPILDKIL